MVVLTGGIASGKTTVSDRFRSLGVPVIDTDELARELVEPGTPALAQIKSAFGPAYLDNGRLDRKKLRKRIFDDPTAKSTLESILHPAIRREIRHRLESTNGPYCILVVPLFKESAGWLPVDRILVVDVDVDLQISRVMARDGIDEKQAKAILASQPSRNDRLAIADDVIDNNGHLQALLEEVDDLHSRYLILADTSHSK